MIVTRLLKRDEVAEGSAYVAWKAPNPQKNGDNHGGMCKNLAPQQISTLIIIAIARNLQKEGERGNNSMSRDSPNRDVFSFLQAHRLHHRWVHKEPGCPLQGAHKLVNPRTQK